MSEQELSPDCPQPTHVAELFVHCTLLFGVLSSPTIKKYPTRKPNRSHPWAFLQLIPNVSLFFPYRMVIVGAGYIACEQACIFNNFGSEVHMLYMEEVALGGEQVPQIIMIMICMLCGS